MATVESLEEELRELKRKNNDLVQKVQHWKMLAGQRENEKMDLMKEMNELRLKLSRLRSNGNVQANNLDAAIQSAAQKALAHLVRASNEIATTVEVAKAYMMNREQLDNESPRWSSLGGTPMTAKKDKVHRVPPLMIGGQSIQPVVALTMMDTNNARSAVRSSNSNRRVAGTTIPLPMHMLQDVYIPLTRIDVDSHTQNMETEDGTNANDSAELMQLEDNEEEEAEGSQMVEDFDSPRILDAVIEEEDESKNEEIPPSSKIENPLEGPSWLLDASNQPSAGRSRMNLEPDSTTELDDYKCSTPIPQRKNTEGTTQSLARSARLSREFSPTVRRRKRTSSPPPAISTPRAAHYSPRSPARRLSNSGRVLKVLVAKMRLEPAGEPADAAGGSPPKRAALVASHAPSPNGATVAGVIVEENNRDESSGLASGEPAHHRHRHRHHTYSSTDIEVSEEHRINVDRRTKGRERLQMELQRSHSRERTISGEKSISRERTISREETNNQERTNSPEEANSREMTDPQIETQRSDKIERHKHTHKDRKKQTDVEMEVQPSEQKQRSNSRERKPNVEMAMEVQFDKKEQRKDKKERREKRTDSRENSVERADRHKPSHSRDRSNERHEDVRTDSRASDDLNQHGTSGGASGSRGREGSCDSDSGSGGDRGGRPRRPRKAVVYKEKPLNRKMRR